MWILKSKMCVVNSDCQKLGITSCDLPPVLYCPFRFFENLITISDVERESARALTHTHTQTHTHFTLIP